MNAAAPLVPYVETRKPGNVISLGDASKKARPLTQAERDFIDLVAAGRGFEISARGCGMTPAEARRFVRRPDVREALNAEREAALLCDGVPRALRSVSEILDDDQAPHSTRAKLALGVLEYARKLALDDAARGEDAQNLASMSPVELEQFAASMRGAIDAEFVAVTDPDSPEVSDLF